MVQKGRQQVVIKILCITAAFILWLYTSNDENISTTYRISNIPIEVINEDYLAQSGLALMPNQKFSTSLKVTGRPSDVYSIKPEHFKIVADLSIYALRKGDNRIPINIVKRPGSDISIINDNNMWITVEVDNYVEKTIPIQIKTKGNVKSGLRNGEPIVKPESTVVSGAEKYVGSVEQVIIEVDLSNQDKSFNGKLPLVAVDKLGREVREVKANPQIAEVIVPIQRIREVEINIKTTGELSKDLSLRAIKLVKDKVSIIGDSKDLDNITSIDTEPIDLSQLKNERTTINVKLILPNNIRTVENNNVIEGEVLLDKIIQKGFTLSISQVELQEELNAKLDVTNVSIVVSGTKDLINRLQDNEIRCYVNLQALGKGEYNLPIIFDLPRNVNIVSQNYKQVKVTIEEKEKEVEETTE